MNQAITGIRAHLPAYIAVALIVVNALIDSNIIHVSTITLTVINAILAAAGLGVLHVRQQAALRALAAQNKPEQSRV